jgi:protein-disulfide isomerase
MTKSTDLHRPGLEALFNFIHSSERFWTRGRRALVPIAVSLLLATTFAGLVGCGAGGPDKNTDGSEPSEASVESGSASEGGSAVALVLEGQTVTIDELHAHMQEKFLEEFLKQPDDQVYELHENAIRDLVQRHVIDAAAADRGLTPEALFEEITGNVAEPSVQDVTDWYSQNESRLRGARLEDVAAQIKDLLANEARGEAWASFVGPRVDALDWQMVLEPPRQELVATRLVRGDNEAPVTIMAFSDYQCPYCIRSEPVLAEVLARYPENVRIIHRHFPLDSIHPFARPASEAAMCADEQGKFWEFHDAIFARQGRLEAESFAEIGEELALDLDALGSCMEERRYEAFVQADFVAGQAAGVTGTPAFFINGIPLKGARDADDLSRVVDSELARIESP